MSRFAKIKIALLLPFMAALAGCSSTETYAEISARSPRLVADDIRLAKAFLDALYRTDHSEYEVIVDADSDANTDPLVRAERNENLQGRLSSLREAQGEQIRINLRSSDTPEPWGSGHFIYTYSTSSGELVEVGRHIMGETSADLWMNLSRSHRGSGIILQFTWLRDAKDNIFYIPNEDKVFRFTAAIEPVT